MVKQWTGCPEKLCGLHPWKYWKPKSIYTELCGPLESSLLKRNRVSTEYLDQFSSKSKYKKNIYMSLLYWGDQNWMQKSMCDLTKDKQRRRITFPNLLAIFCLLQPRITFPITARTHWQLMFNLVSLSPPSSIFQSCFPAVWLPAGTGAWACSSPDAALSTSCWTSWVSCHPISPACWGPSGMPLAPPSFLSCANLLRELCLIFKEDVNRYKMLLISICSCSV